MTWIMKNIPAGTPVYIFEAGLVDPERLKGKILTNYMIGSEENEHPQLITDNGKLYSGCQCWWIPIEEAEMISTK